MVDPKQIIRENALRYQQSPKTAYLPKPANDRNSQLYTKKIHELFETVVLPKISQRGEKLIEYWPAKMMWGAGSEVRQSVLDTQPLRHKVGSFVTGCVCISEQSLYLASTAELTKRFPLYNTGFITSVIRGTLMNMAGSDFSRKPYLEDLVRILDFQSLLGVAITTDDDNDETLAIRTANEIWQIYSPGWQSPTESPLEMLHVALSMAISGELAVLWGKSAQRGMATTSTNTPDSSVLAMLKQLGELRDAGVLTEAEFAQKNEYLLKRL